jgi:hypothetical protein
MRLLPSLGDEVSVEVDASTGVSILHPMGAFGASPDMPNEISQMYLADGLGSLKENPSH